MKLIFSIALVFVSLQIQCQDANPFNIPVREGITNIINKSSQNSEESIEQNRQDTSHQLINIQDLSTKEASQNPFDKQNEIIRPVNPKDQKTPVLSNDKKNDIGKGEARDMTVIVLVYSLVMLIILTLSISMDKARFSAMIKSSINSNYLRTLYRDNQAWTNGQGIIFYIFFIINSAFLIWLLIIKINGFSTYNLFIIAGAIIGAYLVRHVVMWLISSIFMIGSQVDLHSFSIGLHNMILGVILLPLIVAVEFLPGISYPTFIISGVVIFLLIYFLRQAKGLLSCFGMRGFNPFYFFIYLCAIEIAPVLVVYKMMNGAL